MARFPATDKFAWHNNVGDAVYFADVQPFKASQNGGARKIANLQEP